MSAGRVAHLRPADGDDLDELLRIGRSAFARPWSAASLRDELSRPDRAWFVVAVDDEVVGYGGVADLAGDAHVLTVAVADERRRCGHGLALVGALLTVARERFAVRRATLEVRASNTAARALYRRAGFTEAGVRPGYYQDDGEDAVVLWCEDLDTALAALPLTGTDLRPPVDAPHQPEEDTP